MTDVHDGDPAGEVQQVVAVHVLTTPPDALSATTGERLVVVAMYLRSCSTTLRARGPGGSTTMFAYLAMLSHPNNVPAIYPI